MIIIIDEASAKLASFYYHDEIFKPQWKCAVEMTSAPANYIWIVSNRQQKQVRRRYNHIPWHIGETDRCLIRELSLSDLPALYELYDKPGMTDFVEPLYDYETELEYQKAYIENMYGFYEYGMWLVFSRETGKLIGRAGLEHDELGYMIAPELWNQGYATEVCRFIIDYARKNADFEELYCRIDERNTASVRLAKKLGFTNSGHMDEDINASIYRKNIKNNEKH